MKQIFCTNSDSGYMEKGLALYQSLMKVTAGNMMLYYLCQDDKIYQIIKQLDIDALVPIALSELEGNDTDLHAARSNPPSKFGDAYSQFCWALTPYFTNYVLEKFVKEGERLSYVDADLYFYENPADIWDEIGDKSIGIHTHRFENYDEDTNDAGEYNVGVVCFRKTDAGLKCSRWWKSVMLTTNHQYYEKYGSCGDQKYLDLFIRLFGEENVCVFDQERIGHNAPWCFSAYQYQNGQVIWKGKNMKVYWQHFSHFNSDFENDTWRSYSNKPPKNPEWRPDEYHEDIRKQYQQYHEAISTIHESMKETEIA